jgi:hypothetical protein
MERAARQDKTFIDWSQNIVQLSSIAKLSAGGTIPGGWWKRSDSKARGAIMDGGFPFLGRLNRIGL